MDTDTQEVWLTREQVAQRLQMPVKTIAEWGRVGYGPPYAVMGRHCRYPLDRLLDWEKALLDTPKRDRSQTSHHPSAPDDAAGGDHHDH